MSKIKTIQFKLELEGNGIVNFDSKEQKWTHNSNNTPLKYTKGDNVNYSKKNFYKRIDSEGKEHLDYRIKISSDCLKKNIYGEDIIATSPNILHHDQILYNYISSPAALTRGYLFARKTESLKRKGAISLTDAEQIGNAFPYLDTNSKGEFKPEKTEEDDTSSNTYYNTENVGHMEYVSEGAIDLSALQLVSCDEILDRYSFNPDNFGLYKQSFDMHFGNVGNIKLGYHKLKSSVINLDERSILLSDDYVRIMVKKFLTDLLKLDIRKRKAYAKLKTLKIRLVDNPLKYTKSNEEGWVTISSEEDINNLVDDMSVYEFYEEVDQTVAIEHRKVVEDNIKDAKKIIESVKKVKASEKKAKAAAKKEAIASEKATETEEVE